MSDQKTAAALADLFGIATAPAEADAIELAETASENLSKGRESMAAGNFTNAIAYFKESIRLGSPDALSDLGAAYSAAEDLPLAYGHYLRALKAEGGSDAHLGLGEVMKRSGRYRDAIAHLQKAIELEPTQSFHHYKLAETLREMGERKKALSAIESAILISPDIALYHFFTGELLVSMDRAEESISAYRSAVELSPGDDFYFLRLAVAFWKAGKRKEAIKSIQLASDLNPEEELYPGFQAILLEEDGDLDAAIQLQEKVDKMDRYAEERLSRLLTELSIEP
jgi:tetratricopeptide (TPR) repeat protein